MTVSLKHTFVSNVADSSDTSLVQPSNWNAEHTLTAAANTLLGAVTAGAVTEITCTSAGRALLDDADAAAQRTTLAAAGTGVTNTFSANQIISVTDNTNAALRVTQLGTGDAFVVEDSANPDSSPFVINAGGNVGVGYAPLAYSKIGVKNDRTSTTYSLVVDNYNGVNFENSFFLQYDSTGTQSLGNYQAANLAFLTSNTERMRVAASGNISIGNSDTTYPLHLFRSTGEVKFNIESGTTGQDTYINFTNGSQGGSEFLVGLAGAASNSYVWDRASGRDLILGTANTERMRILSTGLVGIGKTNPATPLDMAGQFRATDSSVDFRIIPLNSATATIFGNASSSDLVTYTNNTERMRVSSAGLVGINTSAPEYYLDVTAADNVTTTSAVSVQNAARNYGLGLGAYQLTNRNIGGVATTVDYTFDIGGDLIIKAGNSERMRVVDTGQIQIATSSIGAGKLNISGYQDGAFYGIFMVPTSNSASPLAFTNAAQTVIGSITTTASATFYNTSSDYRLKDDLRSIQNASGRLTSLRPVNFRWRADDSRSDGFVAHEVREIVPEAVTGEKDAVDKSGKPIYQALDHSKLVPLLTAALQETIKRIDSLESKFNRMMEQKPQ